MIPTGKSRKHVVRVGYEMFQQMIKKCSKAILTEYKLVKCLEWCQISLSLWLTEITGRK